MKRYRRKNRYYLNTRGKTIIVTAIAVAAALVITFGLLSARRDNDPAFLRTLRVPEWIEPQYIDMNGTNARKGALLEEINGIVVHYVANPGTTAAQNRSYFNNEGTTVNSHFIVGLDGEIIQCVPLYEQSVASNDRNIDTISIEVCHPDETGAFTDATYDALVRLCAWLAAECDFKQDDIIRHHDVTGKLCPKYFVENEDAWAAFKTAVTEGKKGFEDAS